MAAKAKRDASSLDHDERVKRLRERGMTPRGGGDTIEKWETGMEVEGRFCGIRKGSLGYLIDVEDKSGTLHTYGCPTVLRSRVEGLENGAVLNVLCVGKQPSKKGQDMWVFEVYAGDAGAID